MKQTMIRFLSVAIPLAFTLTTLPSTPASACSSPPLPPACANAPGAGPVAGIGTLYKGQFQEVPGYSYFGFVGAVLFGPSGELGSLIETGLLGRELGADTKIPAATNDRGNALWGDYAYLGAGGLFGDGNNLVHIEPDPTAQDVPAGTDAMDNTIDSAAIEIQDTPTPAGPPRPGGFTHPTRTVTLPDGQQIQVPDGLNLNGSRVTANHGKRTTRQGEITVLETADGKIYGVDANGNNLGPMHESRHQPFPDQKQYSFEDGYPLPPPSANQSAGAADDQASVPNFNDGFESGDTSGWATTSSILSDRRLKTDIVRVGALPSGLPLYRFKYIWSPATHIGVMAQEALLMYPDAVRELNGFLAVDYSRIR